MVQIILPAGIMKPVEETLKGIRRSSHTYQTFLEFDCDTLQILVDHSMTIYTYRRGSRREGSKVGSTSCQRVGT